MTTDRTLRVAILFTAVVLSSACGLLGYNCWDCGGSVTVRNTTAQAVDVTWSDERFNSKPRRVEPGAEDFFTTSTPARGDLRALFMTIRASDAAGTPVFCKRMSWRQYLDREVDTIDIVQGELGC